MVKNTENSTSNRIVITSALPYANGSIHIGHLVEYIQTDVYVRFLKLIGKDAIYCCADDTHGTPIDLKAGELGVKPEELIKKVWKEHTEDFKSFQIEFDSYYSTNSSENKVYADQIFNALNDKGLIYTKDVENFYDEKEKRFLPDRYVKGECPKCGAQDQYGDVCEKCNATYKPVDLVNPYSVISKETPIRKSSKHYFFKLSQLSDKLDKWLTENKNLQPEIVNYVRNWIKEGLQDWDISRDGPYFGFNIPGEADKYYYVWLDAPVGYIASTQNYCKNVADAGLSLDAEKDYWKNKDASIIHFIGKDIIYFHFLFWPAMLMEAGFNLPEDLVVHGFLTVNGEKMSKSRGTFLTAKEFLEKAGKQAPEHLRYYFTSNLGRSMSDIDLDLNDYSDKVNNELVANVANFVYRTLSFTERNINGQLTSLPDDNEAKKVIAEANESYAKIKASYEKVQFRQVVQEIMHVSTIGNRYMQENAPWKLIKEDREKAQKILTLCANLVRNLAVVLKPILPKFSENIEAQLAVKTQKWENIGFDLTNHKLGKALIYFKKIEPFSFAKKTSPLNLKVAKILEIEPHPNADKLYVLKIDLGDEQRTLIAGLKPFYAPEELKSKNIVVITNLQPANLRGIVSQGMLLAASEANDVGALNVPDAKPGTQVYPKGLTPETRTITIKDVQALKLEAKAEGAFVDGELLVAGEKGELKVIVDKGLIGKIR